MRSNLARYKVPRDVVFLDRLPRNSSGKVLNRELSCRKQPHESPSGTLDSARGSPYPRPHSY